ncbi:hypothetical protein BDN70DRAFT_923141 [Pholiota conissans]|uniref:Uncharacterized protein n=1 Tax=Pholiota conissans TaxID=109636 RepID=A0A9P5YX04_9AGAR|nr:hypothetical protein BDN70DRAFT_923141 [Pholiota conissans]
MSSANDGIFMSIAEALGPASKSFEEVRIEDYIKAYQTTGRPPAPVPQEPVDEMMRKTLNLPPLFKPYPVPWTGTSTALATTPQRITNPAELPPAQEYRMRSTDADKFCNISCMHEYEFFSHEELRYYAYLAGHIQPPHPIKMEPFVQVVKATPSVTAGPGEEKLQNISAQTGYEKHSPEEFRVAYLLHRRELTSAELLQPQNPSAPAGLLHPPPIMPIAISPVSMSPLPAPVFGSTTPSIPKFTFGFK